jgi:signal transduction histidine kinase
MSNPKTDFFRFLRFGDRAPSREPGARMFQGVRLRLTLWYCSVLAAALVLFSVALYVGVKQVLLNSTRDYLTTQEHARFEQWEHSGIFPCSTSTTMPRGGFPYERDQTRLPGGPDSSLMIACFDQNNNLVDNSGGTGQYPAAFLSNSLAKTAWQTDTRGQPVTDTVDGGGNVGSIYRCAQVISVGGSRVVLQVGTSIAVQESALQVLLMLLVVVGAVMLVGAGLGGFFLAQRALEPTRQAFTRQQRFIADASHELRTPLTLLHADADVLLRGRKHLPEEDVALLEDIVSEVNHMANLTNRMLTLARLDADALHREHEVVHLDEVTRAVVQRVTAFAAEKDISIQLENKDTPSVIGDSALLEQVVLALVDNAIKYNRQGGQVTVLTAVRDQQALIEISDTGVGIPPEHLPHLMERFYRVDKARSREAGGTGLGLSIAHGIAIAHGGTLTLSSTPDQGTTVTLLLPLARNAAEHQQEAVTATDVPSLH